MLRDLTERVIVASKGRFERARPKPVREAEGLPFEDTIAKSDFMAWTTDVWDIPTESAIRVGHPAPFPVELPQRLIELYTYRGDLVLDPFMGSGSTAVAAVNTHRNFAGYDTDPAYVTAATERADQALAEREQREQSPELERHWWFVSPSGSGDDAEDFQARAVREGRMAKELARDLLIECGFTDIAEKRKVAGVEINFEARDQLGNRWYFDVSGAFSRGNARAGLRRTDTLWKALGKAAVLHESGSGGLPPRPAHHRSAATGQRRGEGPGRHLPTRRPDLRRHRDAVHRRPATAAALRRERPRGHARRELTGRRWPPTRPGSPSWPPPSASSTSRPATTRSASTTSRCPASTPRCGSRRCCRPPPSGSPQRELLLRALDNGRAFRRSVLRRPPPRPGRVGRRRPGGVDLRHPP